MFVSGGHDGINIQVPGSKLQRNLVGAQFEKLRIVTVRYCPRLGQNDEERNFAEVWFSGCMRFDS
jgi:hypothetical protein